MPGKITTHILDTSRGVPAADVTVTLEWQIPHGENWKHLSTRSTNADGRVPDLLSVETSLAPGIYRLTFATGEYFVALSIEPVFYPRVRVEFAIADNETRQHFHIPLLLSPYAYSTYRGS